MDIFLVALKNEKGMCGSASPNDYQYIVSHADEDNKKMAVSSGQSRIPAQSASELKAYIYYSKSDTRWQPERNDKCGVNKG